MTSTPSRTIVIERLEEGRPEGPRRPGLEPGDQGLDLGGESIEPAGQLRPLEPGEQVAAEGVELDLQRPDRLRAPAEQVSLQRLELRHVDRRQLGRGLIRPVPLGFLGDAAEPAPQGLEE